MAPPLKSAVLKLIVCVPGVVAFRIRFRKTNLMFDPAGTVTPAYCIAIPVQLFHAPVLLKFALLTG